MQTFERLKQVVREGSESRTVAVGGFRRTNSRPVSSLGTVSLGMLFPAVVTSVTQDLCHQIRIKGKRRAIVVCVH